MNRKIQLVLLALLAFQAVLIFVLYRPADMEEEPVVDLAGGMTAEDVNHLVIAESGDKVVTLQKEAEADWLVSDSKQGPYPADITQLTTLLSKLTGLQSDRLVTRTTASHIRLKVDETVYGRKVTLRSAGNKSLTLFFGTSPGQQIIHVRSQGIDEVYLARGLSSWELPADLESWWARDYLKVDPKKLERVFLDNDHGSFTLVKESEGDWRFDPAGEESPACDLEAISDFLTKVSYLPASDYVGHEDSEDVLAHPAARLTLTTEEGETTVLVGPQKEEDGKDRLVKASSSPFYVRVSSYALTPLLDMKREELLPQEEELP